MFKLLKNFTVLAVSLSMSISAQADDTKNLKKKSKELPKFEWVTTDSSQSMFITLPKQKMQNITIAAMNRVIIDISVDGVVRADIERVRQVANECYSDEGASYGFEVCAIVQILVQAADNKIGVLAPQSTEASQTKQPK